MTKKLIIIFAFIFSLQGFSQKEYLGDGPYSQLIIRGVMLINGDGSPPRGPMDIVVENNKIVDMQIVGYPGVKINEKKRPILKKGGQRIRCKRNVFVTRFYRYAWSYWWRSPRS